MSSGINENTPAEWKTDVSHLFNNPKDSDVTFMVEGVLFYAHKHVICTRCPYFRSLLEKLIQFSDMEVQIDIRDASAELFAILLRYIYTNMVIFPPTQAWSLYALSQNYRLQDLQVRVQLYMASTLNAENLYQIWSHAQLMGARFLSKICADYFEKNVANASSNRALPTLGTTLFLNHLSIENGVGISVQQQNGANIHPSTSASASASAPNLNPNPNANLTHPLSSSMSDPPSSQIQPSSSVPTISLANAGHPGSTQGMSNQGYSHQLPMSASSSANYTNQFQGDSLGMERRNSITSLFSGGNGGGFDFSSTAYAGDFHEPPHEPQSMGYSPFGASTAATMPDEFMPSTPTHAPAPSSSIKATTAGTGAGTGAGATPTQFYSSPSPFSMASPNTAPNATAAAAAAAAPSDSQSFSIAPVGQSAQSADEVDADGDANANANATNEDTANTSHEFQKLFETGDTSQEANGVSAAEKSIHPVLAGLKRDVGLFTPPTPIAPGREDKSDVTLPRRDFSTPFPSSSSSSSTSLPSPSPSLPSPSLPSPSLPSPYPSLPSRPTLSTNSQSSATSSTSDSLLEKVLILMKGLIPLIQVVLAADRCSIYVHDATRAELCTLFSAGPDVMHLRIPDTTGIAGSVYNSGQAVNIPDAYSDPRFYSSVDQNTGYKTRSMLCAPVKVAAGSRTAGVIQVLNKRGGLAFSSADEQLLQHFVAVAAAFLDRVREDSAVLRGVSIKGKGLAASGLEDSGEDDETATQLTNRTVSEAEDSQSQYSGASGRERARSVSNQEARSMVPAPTTPQEPRFDTFHIDPNQKPRRPKKPVRPGPSDTQVQPSQQKKYKTGQFPVFHFRTSKK